MISRGLLVALAALAALGAGVGAGTAGVETKRKPVVVLVSDGPVALRGRGFAARERLTVRVSVANRVYTMRVRATALGTFTARFTEAAANECEPLAVSVTGTAGSRAALTRKIQIPPACGVAPQP